MLAFSRRITSLAFLFSLLVGCAAGPVRRDAVRLPSGIYSVEMFSSIGFPLGPVAQGEIGVQPLPNTTSDWAASKWAVVEYPQGYQLHYIRGGLNAVVPGKLVTTWPGSFWQIVSLETWSSIEGPYGVRSPDGLTWNLQHDAPPGSPIRLEEVAGPDPAPYQMVFFYETP